MCTELWHTVSESYSTNNVLLGTETISALCGRTVALFLKSWASSSPLFYWQTIQQHWHICNIVEWIWFFWGIDTLCKFFFSSPFPKLQCIGHCQSWMYSNLSQARPKISPKTNCTDTWKYFVLLALIPVSISCVMDLPVMSAQQWSNPNWQASILSVAASTELSYRKWSLVQLNIGPGGRTKPWALLYIMVEGREITHKWKMWNLSVSDTSERTFALPGAAWSC